VAEARDDCSPAHIADGSLPSRERASELLFRRIDQQPQSTVHIRLVGPVTAGDDRQRPHTHPQIAERAVVAEGKRLDHAPSIRQRSERLTYEGEPTEEVLKMVETRLRRRAVR